MNVIELEDLPSEIAEPEFFIGDNQSFEQAPVEATVPPEPTIIPG